MNKTEAYLLSVIRGRRGLLPFLLRILACLLSWVYIAGLEIYLFFYKIGIRKRKELSAPVVSVGNLTTGGTGKTPMTQAIARLFQADGKRIAILNRGYKGENEYGCAIVSDETTVKLNAKQAGDEAFMLASTLPGVPVVVGKERRFTGEVAIDAFQPDALLLDDGMQFWQLHRDVEICLINACDPFDNGWTLPRGLLREPVYHLRKASIVILTHALRADPRQVAALTAKVNLLAPHAPVFTADLHPIGVREVKSGRSLPLDALDGQRVIAFSALANPAAFESMVGEMGGVLAARRRFRDHHAVTLSELAGMYTEAVQTSSVALVTTEKDAVKLQELETDIPIWAIQVEMRLNEPQEFYALLSRLCFTRTT